MKKNEILEKIKNILIKNNLSLSCAESCTGGLISSYLTDIAGASGYIFQNFVTYSNEAKEKFLKVQNHALEKEGAVSEIVAHQMALGLLDYADCAISSTGILGPSGGSKDKPIGLVYIGLGYKNKVQNNIKVVKYISPSSGRYEIKKDITLKALMEFLLFLEDNKIN